ncbi:cytochrome c oxidase assembly protein, partial [Salmonella enterica]|uniref:cytochrome c oxidase assembly protein n=1 Tax=Salmonella enterica TaxID=28901 RepID=UPI003CF4E4BF
MRSISAPGVAVPATAALVWLLVSSDLLRWWVGDLLGRQMATAVVLLIGSLLVFGFVDGYGVARRRPAGVRLLMIVGLSVAMAAISVYI